MPSGNESMNPYRYCGEYFDEETGFTYLRARYYNAKIGRFISEGAALDGLNWYVYVANNPVKYKNPSGLAIEIKGKEKIRKKILKQLQKLTELKLKLTKKGKVKINNNAHMATRKPAGDELIHADRSMQGVMDRSDYGWDPYYDDRRVKLEELRIVGLSGYLRVTENKLRLENGLRIRVAYCTRFANKNREGL